MKKEKKNKTTEPSLIKKLITIYYEQALRRKALRILKQQDWSVDFLALLLVKSVKYTGEGLELHIVNKSGQSIRLAYNEATQRNAANVDDSIFDHLDDEAAIQSFVNSHSVRR